MNELFPRRIRSVERKRSGNPFVRHPARHERTPPSRYGFGPPHRNVLRIVVYHRFRLFVDLERRFRERRILLRISGGLRRRGDRQVRNERCLGRNLLFFRHRNRLRCRRSLLKFGRRVHRDQFGTAQRFVRRFAHPGENVGFRRRRVPRRLRLLLELVPFRSLLRVERFRPRGFPLRNRIVVSGRIIFDVKAFVWGWNLFGMGTPEDRNIRKRVLYDRLVLRWRSRRRRVARNYVLQAIGHVYRLDFRNPFFFRIRLSSLRVLKRRGELFVTRVRLGDYGEFLSDFVGVRYRPRRKLEADRRRVRVRLRGVRPCERNRFRVSGMRRLV